MLLASRLPAVFWRKWAGHGDDDRRRPAAARRRDATRHRLRGNRNWLVIGSFSVQPSELVKVALVIWLGLVLARKSDVLDDWRQLTVPIAPVAGAVDHVRAARQDLGTALILISMVLGALFFAGVRLRYPRRSRWS